MEERINDCKIDQPCIKILGKRRALLLEDYDAGHFIVPAGFQFDGATIPRIVWSVIGLSPFGRIVGPACGHDFLYANNGHYLTKTRKWLRMDVRAADFYFYNRCKATNVEMNWLQERLVLRAVRLFGRYDEDGTSNVGRWNKDYFNIYNAGRYKGVRGVVQGTAAA